MTQDRHPLDRLADRGEPRGADAVLRAAHDQPVPRRVRRAPLAVAAAVIACAITGAVLLSGGDDESSLRTAESTRPSTPATTAPPGRDDTGLTAFGFDTQHGIVRLVASAARGGTLVVESLDADRGEEGSAHLTVSHDGGVVFHDMIHSGCRSDVVRTEVNGTSEVIVENGSHPALDPTGSLLAHATGTECTGDADVLAVRNLVSGTTVTMDVGESRDGPPMRVLDLDWVGDRIAMLATSVDGEEIGAPSLLLYSATADDGPPGLDAAVPLGAGGDALPNPLHLPHIEPVPGEETSLLYVEPSRPDGSGTTVTLVDVDSGEARPFLSVPETVSSFAARSLDDLVYVTVEPKVPGVRAARYELHRRIGDQHLQFATTVSAVALPEPGPSTSAPTTSEPTTSAPTSAPPPSSSATTEPQPDGAVWDEHLRTLEGRAELHSGMVQTPDGPSRVVARSSPTGRFVDVATFDDQRWYTAATVHLPPPDHGFGTTRSIQSGDVTGDNRADFLVPLDAAQPIGVVVSDHGGEWRALPVTGADGTATEPYLGVDPRIEGGQLVSDERVCEPTCAEGGTRPVIWRYDDGTLARTA